MKTLRTKRYPRQGGNGSLIALIVLALVCVAVFAAPEGLSFLPSPAPSATPIPLPEPSASAIDSALILERQSWYAVQLGAYDTREEALDAAVSYQARGAAGYIVEDGLHRLLASAYVLREDAEAVVARMQVEEALPSATLYRLNGEEVTLRVVATPIQSSAIAQGYALLPEMIQELSRLSLALDLGTMDEASISAAAATNRNRIHQLLTTMDLSLSTANNTVVTGLRELLQACESSMAQLVSEKFDNPLSFSANIKYNHLDILWRYVQYVRQMTAYGQ